MDTIYWAVKLDDANKAALLARFPPKHSNIYAEHMTIIFKPSESVDEALMKECGTEVTLEVIGYGEDQNGQAVVVKSDNVSRVGGGIAHITISCANGVRPVYSNTLLQKHWNQVSPTLSVSGVIARFTKDGWDTCDGKQ